MFKRLVPPLLLLLIVLAGAWALLRDRPVVTDVGEVVKGPIRMSVEEEGKTRVKHRYLVSAPVQGRLLRVALEEGDRVEKGKLLAEIDPLPLRAKVEESKAKLHALRSRLIGVRTKRPKPEELQRAGLVEKSALESCAVAERELEDAKAALVKARKDYARVASLVQARTLSQEALDAATASRVHAEEKVKQAEIRIRIRDLDASTAKLDAVILLARTKDYDWEEEDYRNQIKGLEASLQALEDDLHRTRIMAPASGVVLRRMEESQQVVAAGTPLLEIGDPEDLEVEADFLSEDAARMHLGMPAEIFGRALGDEVVPAQVDRIYPSAFQKISSLGVEEQRVTVVLRVEKGALPKGDRYRVQARVILDRKQDAVLVPEGALFRYHGAWHVFKVSDGVAHLARVETGLRDGLHREVTSGLAPGDRVVLHPDNTITDGTRVEAVGGAD